jgi:hypothetical protein
VRCKGGFKVYKTAARVLLSRTELVLFPVLSMCICIAALASVNFWLPALFDFIPRSELTAGIVVAGFYFAIVYTLVFFHAALISQADVTLRGGNPSVIAGLRVAGANWARLVPWAIVCGTVAWLLAYARKHAPAGLRWLVFAAEAAWEVATFLILPTLIFERRSFRGTVEHASHLLKQAWGENTKAVFEVWGVAGVIGLPAIILCVFHESIGIDEKLAYSIAGVWLIVDIVISSALRGVFQAALYRYVQDEVAPPAFAGAGLERAFVAS